MNYNIFNEKKDKNDKCFCKIYDKCNNSKVLCDIYRGL